MVDWELRQPFSRTRLSVAFSLDVAPKGSGRVPLLHEEPPHGLVPDDRTNPRCVLVPPANRLLLSQFSASLFYLLLILQILRLSAFPPFCVVFVFPLFVRFFLLAYSNGYFYFEFRMDRSY